MDKFWDLVDAARQKPAVAVVVVVAAIAVIGGAIGFILIAV